VLPARVANNPRWVLPAVALVILVVLIVDNPSMYIDRRSDWVRWVVIGLIVLLGIANAASAGRLVVDIARDQGLKKPWELLVTGGAIWLVNVVVFALWYWEGDRDGPVARSEGSDPHPDFLFPQMTDDVRSMVPSEWEPYFVDYFYLAFTNATAFSPTDVMPLTRWAKLAMMAQSAISIALIILVVARAVNLLK
jgi:hypothetical protein